MGIIIHVEDNDFELLTELWEASVRATHDFLTEKDIQSLRLLVKNDYLPAVNLRLYQDDRGEITGFVGVYRNEIKMLFIDPGERRKGVGGILLKHAVEEMGADEVNVNEQNSQAVAFYEHFGFKTIKRTETDNQGKPYPLLRMKLEKVPLNACF